MSIQPTSVSPENKVKTIIKFNFGIGAAAMQMQEWTFSTILFFYYVNVVGLSASLAGIGTFISLFFDAVTDPITGSISDRWHSKLGRRHPFMYASALPLAVGFYLLFVPPATSNQLVLFSWFLGFSIFAKVAITLFSVTHLSFGSELSEDFIERSNVMAYYSVFNGLGGVFTGILAFGVFFKKTPEYTNGLLNPTHYPMYALTIAAIMFALIIYSTSFTRSEIPRLPKTPKGLPRFKITEFLNDIRTAIKNHNFLVVVLGLVLFVTANGITETISLFLDTYFWEFSTNQLAGYAIVVIFSSIAAFMIAPALHRRIGKRNSILIFLSMFVFFATYPIILRLAGLLFPNHHPALYPFMLCNVFVKYASLIAFWVTAFSMISDITDENELETGRRQEGIFFSTRTLASKLTYGIGHLSAGLALDHIVLFPKGGKGEIEVGSVAPDVIWRLGMFTACALFVFVLLAGYFFRKYNITQKKHNQTQEKLKSMRLQPKIVS